MAPTSLKLTKRAVESPTPQQHRYVVWDSELKGFGMRVEKSGTKTFFLRYRAKGAGRNGAKRFVAVGRYGPMTPDGGAGSSEVYPGGCGERK